MNSSRFPGLSRRGFLFAGILGGGVALTEGFRLAQSEVGETLDVESLTPDTIGDWRRMAGPEMIVPQDSEPSRFYEEELARAYGGAGLPLVMLAIAYASRQDERLEVHRPEVCYSAQGFELTAARSIDVPLAANLAVPAVTLIARRHDRSEQIVYWTRIGKLFPRTPTEQKFAALRSSLALQIPDGMVVRISTLGTAEKDVLTMVDFARLLLASSPAPLRHALAG
ncbi:MAG: EpsI family protein [Bacteroidetes bacterium]|nr:EpsI family protein [Bacteroidota bacterium]